MEVIEIPIASSSPHFVQENEIFGQTFFLEFEWIEAKEFWLLHVADGQGKQLASGIKLQSDWPLYAHHETKLPWTFILLSQVPGQNLDRSTLNSQFILVACEAV
jgi:hypothetical protein